MKAQKSFDGASGWDGSSWRRFCSCWSGSRLSSFARWCGASEKELDNLEQVNAVLDQHAQEMDDANRKLKDKESTLMDMMEDLAVQKRNLQTEVSERIKIEKGQKDLLQKFERVNKELNDFSYVVSHDLKAPLRGIGSLATWLVSDYGDKLDKEAKESLDLMADRVKRMSSLIDGLLQLAKLGRTEGEPQDVDLNVLLHDIVDFINPPKNIKVTVDPNLPIVFYDRTRLQQVFQNLLSNAIKYMDKPKGKVDVSVIDQQDAWKFSIQDNGPGIDKKHHQKIFQIFQTLGPARLDGEHRHRPVHREKNRRHLQRSSLGGFRTRGRLHVLVHVAKNAGAEPGPCGLTNPSSWSRTIASM